MLDYIYLSQTAPWSEPCAQVRADDYLKNSRIEVRTYIKQLKRTLGTNPEGSFFKVIRCPHDFGTYLDIRFYYDDEDQSHVTYMMDVETGCDKWDDEARKDLRDRNYMVSDADEPINHIT